MHDGAANLALAGLEAVNHGRDGAHVVRHGEQNELLVHKVEVADGIRVVVQERAGLEIAQPVLAIVDLFLAEGQVDAVVVLVVDVLERNVVAAHVAKVLLGLLRGRGAQTWPGNELSASVRQLTHPCST